MLCPCPRWPCVTPCLLPCARYAQALGALVDNRAGQAYDAKGQRVCNYGEVFGPGCYFTADGSFAPVDGATRCPKDFTIAIEQVLGAVGAGGSGCWGQWGQWAAHPAAV